MRVLVRYGLVTFRWLWLLWLWIILFIGVLSLLISALFYRLSDYRPQIEYWASEILQQPIIIGDISTDWIDGAPTLELQQVRLVSPDKQSFIELPQVRVGLSMLTSLQQKQVVTSQINLNINRLNLHRQLDGSIRVVGFTDTSEKEPINTDARFLLQWLLKQQDIQLQIQQITWQELQQPYLNFYDAGITLQKKGQNNYISGQIHSQTLKHGLQFNTVSQWENTNLYNLIGQIKLLSKDHFPVLSSQIEVNPNQQKGWEINLSQLHTQPTTIQPNQLHITINPNGYQYDVTAKLAFLDLESSFLLAKTFFRNTTTFKSLKSVAMKGKLEQIHFFYPATKNWSFSTKLENIYLKYQKHNIKQLSGNVVIKPEQADIRITHADLDFIEPSLYSHSLDFKQMKADIQLKKHDTSLVTYINEFKVKEHNTPIRIDGKIITSQHQIPYLDLKVKIGKVAAKQVYRYLPDKEIAQTSSWLKKSLLSGELETASLHLKGDANTVFKLEKNQLQFDATVRDITLNYADNWFPIEKLDATLNISNNQLTILPTQASLLNSSFQYAKINIPKLTGNDKKVFITGRLNTTAQKVFKFLYETPLADKIDLERQKIQIKGQVDVDLDLDIGLDQQPDKIKGAIHFKNNQLQENFIGHKITHLTGQLFFTDKKLFTQNLKGMLWQQPVVLNMKLEQLTNKLAIQINAQGKMDQQFINQEMSTIKSQWKDLNLYRRFDGDANCHAKVDIINFTHKKHKNHTKVVFSSDLYGMDMHFPAPFNKIAPLKTPVFVELLFPAQAHDRITVSFGDLLNGVLELDEQLQKGQILIGTRAKAQLPNAQRLDIKGHVTHLSLKDWLQFWHNLPDGEGEGELLPIDIQLRLEQLGLWTQQFSQVKATLTHRASLWRIFIQSQAALGQLQYHTDKDTVNAKLKYLNMAAPRKQYASFQPRPLTNPFGLPEISAHIDHLTFDNKELGNVNVYAKPHQNGWELELFESKAHGLDIQAKGLWTYTGQTAKSQLEVKLHSADTGQLLRRLGYPNPPIEQGFSEGLLDVQWRGGFDDFDLKTMRGHLRLLMTQGEIVDVDPGVGRIFGLFDVAILPKRLFLDFRDITDKGLRFDSIVGEFDIQNGIATTDHMILQSPVAHVEMHGHTHFVEEYYDQTVKIIPHVSNTLPVAGTLVGGLGVGAVTLIIQKMLQREIEKNLYYEYQILGDWDDPQIQALP